MFEQMRRDAEASLEIGGMQVGLPKVRVDASHLLALLNFYDAGLEEIDRLRAQVEELRAEDKRIALEVGAMFAEDQHKFNALHRRYVERGIENTELRAQVEALKTVAKRYLDHSDSGTYRDASGLRPGTSPPGEDLRAALRGEGE